jgi:hypothetical protein
MSTPEEHIMATIVIKDLQENTELDRQAMLAIAGGARYRTAFGLTARLAMRSSLQGARLFDPVLAMAARTVAARTAAAKPPGR